VRGANRQLRAEAAERERAEARLRQAQKMEAVGQLTGGIAHDFNNLLAAIMGNLELISGRASDERIVRWASNAMLAAERGAKLTGQLLAFSRMQHLTLTPVDLNALVDGMRTLIERSLGPGIELVIELDPTVGAAVADANQLELAILNLAINARDAMPGGGRLTVTTSPAQHGWNGEAAPMIGEFVSVSVADTGTGMSPNVLERAFEPFFTTKGIGKGTGLGLSQVYGIAKQSGGAVTIDSAPGRGTTVRILLPQAGHAAVKEPSGDVGRAGAAASKGAQRATVLVVDDDADVRRSLADSLDALGYQVVEAEHGQAGLEALARDPAPDVMILDFAMPGLTGVEILKRVRLKDLNTPVIIISGKVKIGRRSPDGRENLLTIMGPSDMFGELSIFDPGPRTSSATTITEVRAVSMDRDALRAWIADRPEIAEQLLRVLARRLRRTNNNLADLIFTDVPGRVAKQLLQLAQRFGTQEGGALRVTHDLTQEEIAQLVGASRETVNKALADFAARGWLQISARSVLILDSDRLRRREARARQGDRRVQREEPVLLPAAHAGGAARVLQGRGARRPDRRLPRRGQGAAGVGGWQRGRRLRRLRARGRHARQGHRGAGVRAAGSLLGHRARPHQGEVGRWTSIWATNRRRSSGWPTTCWRPARPLPRCARPPTPRRAPPG